jgi:hypothetical protein
MASHDCLLMISLRVMLPCACNGCWHLPGVTSCHDVDSPRRLAEVTWLHDAVACPSLLTCSSCVCVSQLLLFCTVLQALGRGTSSVQLQQLPKAQNSSQSTQPWLVAVRHDWWQQ